MTQSADIRGQVAVVIGGSGAMGGALAHLPCPCALDHSMTVVQNCKMVN